MNQLLALCIVAVSLALAAAYPPGADDDDTCVPGERFMMECNECMCLSSGKKTQAACTLMACYDTDTTQPQPDTKKEKRSTTGNGDQLSGTCVPGTNFQLDCNNCICPKSGLKKGAFCTYKLCP